MLVRIFLAKEVERKLFRYCNRISVKNISLVLDLDSFSLQNMPKPRNSFQVYRAKKDK